MTRRCRERSIDEAETLGREIDERVDVEDTIDRVNADVRSSRESR